ncbi:sulfatase [bacterium]|nr:sulfatase [bacterium]
MKENHYNRRDFLKNIGFGTVALTASWGIKSCAGEGKRPNFLFIFTDDHAAHALSCYGSKINRTPHLDRVAREGVRFDNCFCTNSICAPSRAGVLTGKYGHLNGVVDNKDTFDGSQRTFPKTLRKNGYQTALVGKWHLKSTPTGFDYWNILPGQGAYYNPDFVEMGKKRRHSGYVTEIITDLTLDWLKNRDKKKPFCLMCHHKAPHRNWMPGPKHLHKYEGQAIPEPETLFDSYATRSPAAREQEMTIARHLRDKWDLKLKPPGASPNWNREYRRMSEEQRRAWDAAYEPKNRAFREASLKGEERIRWKYQRYIKDYLRCVASVDESVGKIMDYLDSSGLRENTVVIYSSDQGFFLGDHGWFDKRWMYEESLRLPLLMRYPREIKPGSVNKNMVLNIDFAPTFLDYAGISLPEDIQGRSLRPLSKGKRVPDWRTSIYYHYYEYPAVHSVKRHYGIRTHRYKLIHYYYDIDAWELYDLKNDPLELLNLYPLPEYKDLVVQLKSELEKLQKQYGSSDELTP